MDAAALDELRMLRARAYGPDADIHDDPAAVARLSELEARSASAATSVSVPGSAASVPAAETPLVPADPTPGGLPAVVADPASAAPPAVVADPASAPPPAVVADPEATTSEAPADPARRPWYARWSPRRVTVTAIAVLAIAVVVTAAATTFATRRGGYAGAVQAVLPEAPGVEWPEFFGTPDQDGKAFAEFAGLTVFSTSAEFWGGSQFDECMMVIETTALESDGNNFSGFSYSGCGAGPFPATLTFLVSAQMPEELRERYPIGTAIQFILEGSEVVVLSSPAEPAEATPTR